MPPLKPTVTLHKMPDGSFRIYGLGQGAQVHLKQEMRAWVSGVDEITGRSYYMTRSRATAQEYARAHRLPIQEPARS